MRLRQGPVLIKDYAFVKAVLRSHEGRRLQAYNMGDGHPTLSTGFNLDRKDAQAVLLACGIFHKLSDLKTTKATLTDSQAKRLESYIINEAAVWASHYVGAEKFHSYNAQQQAAAMSLATNSPDSMKKVGEFIQKDHWEDDFLHKKAKACEDKKGKKFPGLYIRYDEIQTALKTGEFPKNVYKSRKIDPPTHQGLQSIPAQQSPKNFTPVRAPVAANITPFNFNVGLNYRVDTSLSLLDKEQLTYFTEARDRLFTIADALSGDFGTKVHAEAMKIGLNTSEANPVNGLMRVLDLGIQELKNPNSKASLRDLRTFTEHGYHLLNDLSLDTTNIAQCVGLGFNLGFDEKKVQELASPFLRAASYFETAADRISELNNDLSKPVLGDSNQSLSAFWMSAGPIFKNIPGKAVLTENSFLDANKNLNSLVVSLDNNMTSSEDWSKAFQGAAVTVMGSAQLTTLPPQASANQINNANRVDANSKPNLALINTLSTINQGLQVFGGLLNEIDRGGVASAVVSIASPAISVATIICSWSIIAGASGPAAPIVALAGALVSLGIAIKSLFDGPQGPTADEVIMYQIQRLAIEIDQRFNRLEQYLTKIAEHLDQRFDQIRNLILDSHEIIVNAISELKQDMQRGFTAVLTRIEALQTTLDIMASRHNALFSNIYMRDFERLLSFSKHITIQQLGQGLNPDAAIAVHSNLDYYRTFLAIINNESASVILAGSPILNTGQEASELTNILKTAFNPQNSMGYESSINTLAAYVHKLDPKITTNALANPLVWSKGVGGFMQFIRSTMSFRYGHRVTPEAAKKLQHTELRTMIEKGNALIQFFIAAQTSKTFWLALIDNYSNAMKIFLLELFSVQWPYSAAAAQNTETVDSILEHVAGLNKLAVTIEDFITSRAGPAAAQNIFHRDVPLPLELTSQFPNPNREMIPAILVHTTRASETRFHAAHHMRTMGRELGRPYYRVKVADETNATLENNVTSMHVAFRNEVNNKRSNDNSGGEIKLKCIDEVKANIISHQKKWQDVMTELRTLPAILQQPAQKTSIADYRKKLLAGAAARAVYSAQTAGQPLPHRALLKKAYENNGNGDLATIISNNNPVKLKLEALSHHAYILKFFLMWLFPTSIELHAFLPLMLWDLERVNAYTDSKPFAQVLQDLLEREHPRLPTSIDDLKAALIAHVETLGQQEDKTKFAEYVDPNVLHMLNMLMQFEKLYFKVTPQPLFKNRAEKTNVTFFEGVIPEDEINFKIKKITGDGHCFFRAICEHIPTLGLPNRDHLQLRAEAVAHLRTGFNAQTWEQLTGRNDFDAYCTAMLGNEWAHGAIIEYTAMLLDIHLVILDKVASKKVPHIIHLNEKGKAGTIMLQRSGDELTAHYDLVIDEELSIKKSNPVVVRTKPKQTPPPLPKTPSPQRK